MRYGIRLSVLLLTMGGCAASGGRGLEPRGPYARAHVPAQLTEKAYSSHRGLYDALPLDHPQRAEYRTALQRHLIARAERQLQRKTPAAAADTLFMAASLHDPAQVYRQPPSDEALFQLAGRIVRAFSPQGDVERVVPALSIQIGLKPRDGALRQQLVQILSWVDESSQVLHGRGAEGKRAIAVLDRAVMIWPTPFVVDTLYRLYLRRATTLADLAGARFFRRRRELSFAALQWTGYNVARMYVWVDNTRQALERLPATSSAERDDVLRRVLERAAAKKPQIEALIQLATVFERRDPLVALRVCRRASLLFSADDHAHSCVGRLAAKVGKTALAVRAYSEAYRVKPTNQRYAELLARQYQNQLFQLIEGEQLDAAQKSLQTIEAFYQEAEKRLGKPLRPPLSKVRFALGFGLYNAGRITDAIAQLERSLQAAPSPEALVQLATIALKSRNPAQSLRYLSRAESLKLPPAQKLYWSCRVTHLRAKALDLAGDPKKSLAAHQQALDLWRRWLSLDVPRDAVAEAQIRIADSLYAQGRAGEALDALDEAIDAVPTRKESYADVIAMLVTRGHLPEALDVLHRALGRTEVTEYLKAYCSFWVIGLARRAGQPPDPLAVRYLDQLSGSEWYHSLAKLTLRKISFAELAPLTKKRAQQAELYFYEAAHLLAKGELDRAKALWRKVIESKMMAFFEYDMAAYNLRHGAAKVAAHPVDRRARSTRKQSKRSR